MALVNGLLFPQRFGREFALCNNHLNYLEKTIYSKETKFFLEKTNIFTSQQRFKKKKFLFVDVVKVVRRLNTVELIISSGCSLDCH